MKNYYSNNYWLIFVYFVLFCGNFKKLDSYEVNCSNVLIGQYSCASPDIDPETQQPRGCSKENKALVNCTTSENIKCKPGTGLDNRNFTIEIPCEYTNGYSFETALLLSIFLGMFGVDRFYLGYPAIGSETCRWFLLCDKLFWTTFNFSSDEQ
ncbi:TM2 domain-containing protein CG10795-like isoform X3 [Limulus polyphemus]|uniref:TM2 domain-containing protein CG10795-like isoform X3 n=1 Tax=Limulus polyphemus TaxID=6850 RepID=A0ABM1T725_LIMPO|nr:TM2 domain-containing protein CG10795-like isoform X3 [Limulus polyphemus]